MAASAPPAAALYYGNQSYSIEQAATRLTDAVLGAGPRDFSYQRFDAAELLKTAPAEVMAGRIDAFQMACEAMPLLGDRRVVRLDRLEAVRLPDRAVQPLRKALDAQRLARVSWRGQPTWVPEDELQPGEAAEAVEPAGTWVERIAPQEGGHPVVHLRALEARFAHGGGEQREWVPLPDLLRARIKPKFALPDEADADAEPPPTGAAGRLHPLLQRLLTAPPDGLTLVLTAVATRETDLSKPLLAALKKLAAPLEKFVTYDDYNPADWVVQEGRARGLRLTRPVAEVLIHRAGNDLGRLAKELDRLSLVFPAGRAPSEDDLIGAVHAGGRASLFQINEKLGNRDLEGALLILEEFLHEKPQEHPVLIGILARHFRQLVEVHGLLRGGVPEAEWPARLKLHPFIAKKVIAQARRFTPLELEHIQQTLAEIDVVAKRNAHLTGLYFKEFIHGVCSGGYRTRRRSLA
jgi:DNA polymerase III delta subunit